MIWKAPWVSLGLGLLLALAGRHDNLPAVETVGRAVVATSWIVLWLRAILTLQGHPILSTPAEVFISAGVAMASLAIVVCLVWYRGAPMVGLVGAAGPVCWVAYRAGKHVGFRRASAAA